MAGAGGLRLFYYLYFMQEIVIQTGYVSPKNPEKFWESVEKADRELFAGMKFHYEYHHVKDKVFTRLDNAIKANEMFGLKCKSSLVVFSPTKLKAYWFGAAIADFQYADMKAFIEGVKFQLLSHNEFVGQQRIIEVKRKALLQFGNVEQGL